MTEQERCGSRRVYRPCTGVRTYDALIANAPLPRVDAGMTEGFATLHQLPMATEVELHVPPVEAIVVFTRLRAARVEGGLAGRRAALSVRAGDIAVLPPGTDSTWLIPAGSGDVLHMHLAPEFAATLLEEELAGRPFELVPRLLVTDEATAAIARTCLAELKQPGMGSRVLLQSQALALAVRLMREHSSLARRHAPADHRIAPYRLRRALDYIEGHLAEEIRLTDIAAAAGLSPSHFAHAFKASTGRSPYRMVVERRVEQAKVLLTDDAMALAEVALACGFGSQQQFTTTFRSVAGTTPGRWRREHSG